MCQEGILREPGVSKKEAERRAWAAINKQNGGGRKSGSERGQGIAGQLPKGGAPGGKQVYEGG